MGREFRRCLSGEFQRCEEEAFARPDGSVRWLRWEIRPWCSAQGEIGGIILFTETISARTLAEQNANRERWFAMRRKRGEM